MSGVSGNVGLELVANALVGVGNGVSTVLVSALLQLLSGDDLFVGLAEGVPAVLAVAAALPAGRLADRQPLRDAFPKDAGLWLQMLGALAAALMIMSADFFHGKLMTVYWLVFSSMMVRQFGTGLSAGQVESIWNASLMTGSRTFWTNLRMQLSKLGSALGPVLAIFLILILKTDQWGLEEMMVPWAFGMICYALAYGIRLQITPLKQLKEQQSGDVIAQNEERDRLAGRVRKVGCIGYKSIPLLKLGMDLWYALASGLTIKYFPLWLKDLGLSPIQLNVAIAGQYLATAALGFAAKYLGDRIGRMQVAFWFRVVGLAFFFVIIVGEPTGLWDIAWLMTLMYVLRTGWMNACSGVTNAVLNDFVPANKRSTWNSLDRVTALGWSGSALLGGLILDKVNAAQPRIGYRDLFLLTFSMQAAGLSIIFLLMLVVPRKELSRSGTSSVSPQKSEPPKYAPISDAELLSMDEASDDDVSFAAS